MASPAQRHQVIGLVATALGDHPDVVYLESAGAPALDTAMAIANEHPLPDALPCGALGLAGVAVVPAHSASTTVARASSMASAIP